MKIGCAVVFIFGHPFGCVFETGGNPWEGYGEKDRGEVFEIVLVRSGISLRNHDLNGKDGDDGDSKSHECAKQERNLGQLSDNLLPAGKVIMLAASLVDVFLLVLEL